MVTADKSGTGVHWNGLVSLFGQDVKILRPAKYVVGTATEMLLLLLLVRMYRFQH